MSQQCVGAVFRRQRLSRAAARRFAATCARRSPRRSVGVRTLAKMIASIAGIGLAVAIQAYRRQAQPLAVDLGHRAIAAGRRAADIGPVRAHAAEAEQAALVEGGRHDVDVGQMRAALVRIVVDEHVARRDVGKRPHHGAHRVRHRAEMDRQIRPLRHHVAVRCRRCRRSSRRRPSAAANRRSWPGRSSSPRPRRSARSSPPRSGPGSVFRRMRIMAASSTCQAPRACGM